MKDVKKNKKIWFLCVFFLVFIVAFAMGVAFYFHQQQNLDEKTEEVSTRKDEVEEEITSTATPLLYEVTKEGIETKMYLFGGIHLADSRAYPMNSIILDAYQSSDALAVEFDLVAYSKNFRKQIETLRYMLPQDGKTLEDYFGTSSYEMLIQYMKENHIYNSAYEMYRPVFIYSLLNSVISEKSGLDTNKGIDMYFLKQAKADKKEILEVESAEEQYSLLGSFSDSLFTLLIEDMLVNENLYIEETKKSYEAWLQGDGTAILSSPGNVDEEQLKELEKLYPGLLDMLFDYNEKLITERNKTMTEKADLYFKEGKNVFFVVGAGHIVGEDGVASRLERLGYTVHAVSYTNEKKE